MVTPLEVSLPDGRTVHAWDAGGDGDVVVWHHGSPQTGAPLQPLLDAALPRGLRLVSYGRPSYGGSTPMPGRDVASAAGDVAAIMDQLGIDRFAVIAASGGGPHALACAALLPERVTAVALLAGIAPLTDEFDWYAGMADASGPRAALQGRAARAALPDDFDESSFNSLDYAALGGSWSSLNADVAVASAAGPDGLIDDDVALVTPWGFSLGRVAAPVLLVQGGDDRVVPASHADWMLRHLPAAELWLRPRDGHISVLDAVPVALDWVAAKVAARG